MAECRRIAGVSLLDVGRVHMNLAGLSVVLIVEIGTTLDICFFRKCLET